MFPSIFPCSLSLCLYASCDSCSLHGYSFPSDLPNGWLIRVFLSFSLFLLKLSDLDISFSSAARQLYILSLITSISVVLSLRFFSSLSIPFSLLSILLLELKKLSPDIPFFVDFVLQCFFIGLHFTLQTSLELL